jgi:spermidine/putrescine-binding protein
MRGFLTALLIVIPLSFGLGLYWTRDKIGTSQNRNSESSSVRPKLNISTYRGWISKAVINEMEAKTPFKINLIEFDRPHELWQRLEHPTEDGAFEMITLTSSQIEAAKQLGRISDISDSLEDCRAAKQMISSDFRVLPDRPSSGQSIPLAWGVTGWLANSDSFKGELESILTQLKKPGHGKNTIQLLHLPSELAWLAGLMTPSSAGIDEGESDESEQKAMDHLKKSIRNVTQNAEIIPTASMSGPFSKWSSGVDVSKKTLIQAHHSAMAFAPFLENKKWTFQLPKEKGLLWVAYLTLKNGMYSDARTKDICAGLRALVSSYSKENEAKDFFNRTGQALPYQAVEAFQVADELKRRLSLSRIDLRKNFAGDVTIENILGDKSAQPAESSKLKPTSPADESVD